MRKTKKTRRTLLASALSFALVTGILGGVPGLNQIIPGNPLTKQARAATTVKTIAELSVGDKVTFKNMSGTLATTWTYCGCPRYKTGYYFECDSSIGSYTSEESIPALGGQESCLPGTIKSKLETLPEGPRYFTLWAQTWGNTEKDSYRRNGGAIDVDQYYQEYIRNGGDHYLAMLPATDAYLDSLGNDMVWDNEFYGWDGLTYPSRLALTSSSVCKETWTDNYYQADSHGVYRNGSGGFDRISSGTRYPVYPAMRFKTSAANDLYFGLTSNGTYTQVDRGQLSFNANGGSGSQAQVTYYIGTGDSVSLPSVTTFSAPEGKFFRGWSADPAGSEMITSLTPTGTTATVYAVWAQISTYEIRNGKKYLTRLNPDYTGTFMIDADTDGIAAGAFDDCALSRPLVIPYNVSEIEAGAFLKLNATSANPAIITIKNPDCVLSQTSFRTGVTGLRGLAGGTADRLAQETEGLECERITVIPSGFFDGEIVRAFNCPLGVTDIGLATDEKGVFEGHTELKRIDLGSVRVIGANAFKGCTGLTGTLTLPETVTTIADGAFSGCASLIGALTIPEGVTTIGNSAFSGCSGLTGALTIPEGVTTIGNSAFSGCSGLTGTLTIPESVTAIGTGAFEHVGVSEIIVKNETIDPATILPTTADGQPITCKHEEKQPENPPAGNPGGSGTTPTGSADSPGGGSGGSSGGGYSGGSSGYSSGGSSGGYSGGSSGYSGGGSSGSSGGGYSGGSSGSSGENGKPTNNNDSPEITPNPTVTPLSETSGSVPTVTPVETSEPATGPSAGIVNDPEEEIPAPVVIEKIVTDISDISSPQKPKRVVIRSVSRIGKKLRIRCKRIKNAGYQIQYTTNKDKWNGSTRKKSKKQIITLKKLDPFKTYYIRIRAFRGTGESRVYGKWSKRIKI
ncbi:MAG: leucine-rich repeat protein [Eubacterium sp.]|nr:leucine-rich repeat protein [Eubacterium sp.]